jgi:hypothetical protein
LGAVGVPTRPEAGIKKRKGDCERKQRKGLNGTREKRSENHCKWHIPDQYPARLLRAMITLSAVSM